MRLSFDETLRWLQQEDPLQLDLLWEAASFVRHQSVGDAVHLRGLLEISNYCDRSCWYCGLRMPNAQIPRYRLGAQEILDGAAEAVRRAYGSVVLQAGEDPHLDIDQLCDVIRRIKTLTPLAVTLSLGERSDGELQQLREAGADRYLLRFETSNRQLFERIHPSRPGQAPGQRRALLLRLRELGYELGSGVMVGLPGQSCSDLAQDVQLFQELDLDMIGIGPYIPHPDTPLADEVATDLNGSAAAENLLTTYKMIALARLACPASNIPSTTALATLDPYRGQRLGLQRGANVIMPNLTPRKYRRDYEIYPHKAGTERSPHESDAAARAELAAVGRPAARGRGDSPRFLRRRQADATQHQPGPNEPVDDR